MKKAKQKLSFKQAFRSSVPKSVSASWDNTTSEVSHGLTAFVKALRNSVDEKTFISESTRAMKQDFRSKDEVLKAQRVAQLAYLYMLGYDTSWAAFHIVSIMSHPEFDLQRVGYWAAAVTFTPETDVLVLTVNSFKNALIGNIGNMKRNSKTQLNLHWHRSVALNCLSSVVNPELAQNLLQDIHMQLNATKHLIRKKAVLLLYSVFRRWPKALHLSFDRLKARLKDDHVGVRTAAVNVICELARRNPKSYLSVIPQLHSLLETTASNWMLIKIVKLMSNILPIEPRLITKLREPLVNIINGSSARSLVYECINCITSYDDVGKDIVSVCVEKLQLMIEDSDQNFKYLGMCGLDKIQSQTTGKLEKLKDLIVERLDEEDQTIKTRALNILSNMVSRDNMIEIVMKLQEHLLQQDGAYMNHILNRIVTVMSQDEYSMVEDFHWYIGTLKEFSYLRMNQTNAALIGFHLMDVIYRVEDAREYGIGQMEELIIQNELLGDNVNLAETEISQILYAAAYLLGEYGEYASPENFGQLIQLILQGRVKALPEDVQSVFMQCAFKLVGFALMGLEWDDAQEVLELFINQISQFTSSGLSEVQERSTQYLSVIQWVYETVEYEDELMEIGEDIVIMYSDKLAPVDQEAQELVKPPKGLKLKEWIGVPIPEDECYVMSKNIVPQAKVNPENSFKPSILGGQTDDDVDLLKVDEEAWLNGEDPKAQGVRTPERKNSGEKKKPKADERKKPTEAGEFNRDAAKESPFYIATHEPEPAKHESITTEAPVQEIEVKTEVDDQKARMRAKFKALQNRASSKKKGKFAVKKGNVTVEERKRRKIAKKKKTPKPKKNAFVDPLSQIDLRAGPDDDVEMPTTKTYDEIMKDRRRAEDDMVADFKKITKKAEKKAVKQEERVADAETKKAKKKAIKTAKKQLGKKKGGGKKKAKGKKKTQASAPASEPLPDLLNLTAGPVETTSAGDAMQGNLLGLIMDDPTPSANDPMALAMGAAASKPASSSAPMDLFADLMGPASGAPAPAPDPMALAMGAAGVSDPAPQQPVDSGRVAFLPEDPEPAPAPAKKKKPKKKKAKAEPQPKPKKKKKKAAGKSRKAAVEAQPQESPRKKPKGKKRPKGKSRGSVEPSSAPAPLLDMQLSDDLEEDDQDIESQLRERKRQKKKKQQEEAKEQDLLNLSAMEQKQDEDSGFNPGGGGPNLFESFLTSSPTNNKPAPAPSPPRTQHVGGGLLSKVCAPSVEKTSAAPSLSSSREPHSSPPETLLSTNHLTILYAVDYSPGEEILLTLTCTALGSKAVKNVTLKMPSVGPFALSDGDSQLLAKSVKSARPVTKSLALKINKLQPCNLSCKVVYKCGKSQSIPTIFEVTPPMLLKQANPPSPAALGKLLSDDPMGVSSELSGVTPESIPKLAEILRDHGSLEPTTNAPLRPDRGPWRFYARTAGPATNTRSGVLVVVEPTTSDGLKLCVRGPEALRKPLCEWLVEKIQEDFEDSDSEEDTGEDL